MNVDVAVIGGGPAGSTVARLLSRAGLKTVIFDAAETQTTRWGETSPPRLRELLVQLDLWHSFFDLRVPHVSGTSAVWGQPELTHNDYLTQTPGYGWHLPRGQLDRWLLDLARIAGATVIRGRRVQRVSRLADLWSIECDPSSLDRITTQWVVDSAGRFARYDGAAPRVPLDRLVVLRASCLGKSGFEGARPLVEASPSGWWFSVGNPENIVSLFYFSDSDLLPRNYRTTASWSGLSSHAPITCERICVSALNPVSLRIAPARSQHVRLPLQEAFLPVGDAALAFDPLSGQGVCFALESGIRATEAILGTEGNLGSATAAYGEWLRDQIDEYRMNSNLVYARELRWPDELFWSRRHQIKLNDALSVPKRREE